jgi:metal-dependent amidase/aminoacylase/carboxypeptidase family protein
LTADTLIQRRLAPTGTTALNVMPLTSSLDIQVRSGDEDYLEKVITRVKDAAKGAALATGATVSISERQRNYQRIIQNKTLEEIAKKNVEETGHKFTYDQPSPYPFGTDSGNVSHVVPVAQFLIGRPEGLKFHTTEAIEQSLEDSAHRLMIEGAKILAGTAIDLLAEPRFVEQAKTEFIEYRANNFKGTISWHTE